MLLFPVREIDLAVEIAREGAEIPPLFVVVMPSGAFKRTNWVTGLNGASPATVINPLAFPVSLRPISIVPASNRPVSAPSSDNPSWESAPRNMALPFEEGLRLNSGVVSVEPIAMASACSLTWPTVCTVAARFNEPALVTIRSFRPLVKPIGLTRCTAPPPETRFSDLPPTLSESCPPATMDAVA